MPVSVTCPKCDARLKAPDGSAGRTLRCPRCAGPVAHLAFEDDGPTDLLGSTDSADSRRGQRPTAKRKAAPSFNPFDEDSGKEPAVAPPKKRRYRKDADYNPFGDLPQEEVSDPVGDGFEFGIEAPPPAPTGEFDFGPLDPGGDDADRRRRR